MIKSHLRRNRLRNYRSVAPRALLQPLEQRALFSFTVSANSTVIADGDTTPSQTDYTDFSYIGVSSGSVYRTYTIQNTGGSTINLNGTPRINITGANAGEFTVTTLPSASISAGGSTTFIITFDPSAVGTRTATVSIANDDGQGTFDFSIQGTGLNTTTSGTGLQTATVTAGTNPAAVTGDGVRVHYTLYLLDGTRVESSRDGAGNPFDFTIGEGSVIQGWEQGIPGMKIGERRILIIPPSLGYGGIQKDTIPPNSTLIFDVEMLYIGGHLSVRGNNIKIPAGDTTPSTTDFTDFGVLTTGNSLTRTFVIGNDGPGDSISVTNGPNFVVLGGASANQFVLTQPNVGGGSGTFTIKFQPTIPGTHTVTVTIPNNGLTDSNFTYTITGRLDRAPSVANFSKSFSQDTTYTFAGSHFTSVFTDQDAGDTLQKIKITSLPAGALKLSNVAVTVNQEITLAQIANLTYTPVAGFFGSDSFAFTASDGYAYSAAAATVTLNVQSTDVTAPTAQLVVRDPDIVGAAFQFQIKFADNIALSAATFAVPNVVFVTRGSFITGATLVSVDVAGNGSARTATYQIVPPGGTWDSADNGRYNVNIAGGVISDTTGNTLAASMIGHFYYSSDPLFSERYYDTRYPDIGAAISSGALSSGYAHFSAYGQLEGRNPSSFFDEHFYRQSNPDVNAAVNSGFFVSGYQHFRLYGAADGRAPSLMFDQQWYKATNSDVTSGIASGAVGSALEHYIRYGQYENRAPSVYFNPAYYLVANADVAAAITNGIFVSAFDHFLGYGAAERRAPVDIYNETYYLANNPDVASAVTSGAFSSGYDHFLRYGQYDGRRPSLLFNPTFYRATYPEIAAWEISSGKSAYYHFLAWGRTEGRVGA